MVNHYEIPQGKALFSAAFIQYCIYAVLYCIEGTKLVEIK